MDPRDKGELRRTVAIFTGAAHIVAEQVNRFLSQLTPEQAIGAGLHLSSDGGDTVTAVTVLVDYEAAS